MREYVNIFKVAPRDAFELQCVQFSRVIARFNKTGNNSNAKKSRRKPAPTNEEDIQKVRDDVEKKLGSCGSIHENPMRSVFLRNVEICEIV